MAQERIFDPGPGDEPNPDKDSQPSKLLPGWLASQLARTERSRLVERVKERLLAEPYNPPRICEVRGCHQPAIRLHHSAPRAIFGPMAERYPLQNFCPLHHDLWHDTIEAYFRAKYARSA
jgi:hypothetical protein